MISRYVKCSHKLEKLMVVIAVATAICIRTGQWQEKIKPTIYKKMVKAPLYSTFRRGSDVLRRWLTDLKNILILLYQPNILQNKGCLKNVGWRVFLCVNVLISGVCVASFSEESSEEVLKEKHLQWKTLHLKRSTVYPNK